jgi:hypothetical protein
VALSNRMQPVSQLTASLDAALLEERTPLVVKGMELPPSSSNRFKRDEKVGLYVEVYEPLMLGTYPPRVGIAFDIFDRRANQRVLSFNTQPLDNFIQPGNPVIPVGMNVPVNQLQAGEYRVDVKALDSAGNVSAVHSAEFAVD